MPKVSSTPTVCSSGCKTKDHSSYAECLKSKKANNPQTFLSSAQQRWDAELHAYKRATEQGIQPDGTSMKHIDAALRKSDASGVAYNAEKPYA